MARPSRDSGSNPKLFLSFVSMDGGLGAQGWGHSRRNSAVLTSLPSKQTACWAMGRGEGGVLPGERAGLRNTKGRTGRKAGGRRERRRRAPRPGPKHPKTPRCRGSPGSTKPRCYGNLAGFGPCQATPPRRAHLGEAALALIRVGREPGRVIHRHGPTRPPESSLLSVRERAEAHREAAALGRMRRLLSRVGLSHSAHAQTPV